MSTKNISLPSTQGVALSQLLEKIFGAICVIAQVLLILFTLTGLTNIFRTTVTPFNAINFLLRILNFFLQTPRENIISGYVDLAATSVSFLIFILFIIAIVNCLKSYSFLKKSNGSGNTLDLIYKQTQKSFNFSFFIILVSYMASGQEFLFSAILCFIMCFHF